MSENTKIEWADSTFNPWEGCQKVGPGCENCYAEARNARFGGGVSVNWGQAAPRRRTSAANWRKPLQWERHAAAFQAEHGRRQRVFCASLADVFDNAVAPEWRVDLFALISETPNLDWLLLTKRIGNAKEMIGDAVRSLYWEDESGEGVSAPAWPWPNVWLGATVVNQEEADRDITKLLAVPARVRFLSVEPMLGMMDLTRLPNDGDGAGDALAGEAWVEHWLDDAGTRRERRRAGSFGRIDWVICGGESGPGARPMHPDWARSLQQQCRAADVAFFMKQMGGVRDKRGALEDLPQDLRVREFPHANP